VGEEVKPSKDAIRLINSDIASIKQHISLHMFGVEGKILKTTSLDDYNLKGELRYF